MLPFTTCVFAVAYGKTIRLVASSAVDKVRRKYLPKKTLSGEILLVLNFMCIILVF